MKAIKRTVAGLLASVMLMSSVSVSLGAETYTADEAVVVAKVNAAGIMTGTDNGFEPSKTLTRAEAAAIMVRMKGIPEAQVKSAAGTTLFGDVSASHWAAGYINVASSLGVIKGVGANTFAPDRTVTIAEMTTMAVRALGAGQLVEAQAGTWPTNYMNFAGEEKLTDGVYNVYTAEATRINAATIVANTLEAPIWEKSQVTTNNEVTWEKSADIIHDDKSITPAKTILNTTLEITVKEAEACFDVSTKDNEFNKMECVEGVDLTNVKKGLLYDYWMNEDGDILGVWETEDNDLKKISFSGVEKVDTDKKEITFIVNGDEKTYDYDPTDVNDEDDSSTTDTTLVLSINEVNTLVKADILDTNAADPTTFGTENKFGKNESMFGTAYVDGGDVIAIYAELYTERGIVDEVTDTKVKFDTEDVYGYTEAGSFKYSDEDKEYVLTKDGKAADFADIEKGDAFYYYPVGTDKYVINVSSVTLKGEVTTVKASEYVKLDGTKFDINPALSLKAGDEIIAYLNTSKRIVMYKEVESVAADVAVVKYVREIEDEYKEENWKVELFLTNGTTTETLTVDLEDTYDEYIEEVTGTSEDEGVDLDGTEDSDLATGTTYYKVADKYFADEDDAKDEVVDILTINLVEGKIICYEISGTKLTVVPEEDEFKPMAASSKLEVGAKLSYIVGSDSVKYYLDSNTKVFNIKSSSKAHEVKVEEVALKDLADTNPVSGFVAGIDEDDNTVRYVFFDASTTVKRTSATNFAFFEKVADTKYDGEKAKEVEVVFVDGTRETYYFTEDAETDLNPATICADKKLVDLTISGDQIIDIDELSVDPTDKLTAETVAANTFLSKHYSRGTIEVGVKSGTTLTSLKEYELASEEELLILEIDEDGDYIVRSIDDIEEFDNDDSKNHNITHITTYKNDAKEDAKVVLIIYTKIQ